MAADHDATRGPLRRLTSKLYHNSALRYLAVGGFSFIIDFSLLYVMHEVVGLPIWLATAIAFLASFLFNYTLQRLFSFNSQASHGATLAKYITLVAFNTIATTIIVSLFDHVVNGWEIGKVVATMSTTVWNYLIYRYWIFVKSPAEGRTNQAHVVIGQVINDPEHTIDHSEHKDV